jgi:hypothetical protein
MADKESKSSKVLEGHRLETSNLRLDLLWLYALFFAMPPAMVQAASRGGMSKENGPQSFDPLAQLYEDNFEPLVTRLLVQSAITLRVMDDHASLKLNDPKFKVGQIQFSGRNAKPLSLRESCNKIIHLDKLEFKYETLDGKNREPRIVYAEPSLALHGGHGRESWRANLSIPSYVQEGLFAARLFGDARSAAERRSLLERHTGFFESMTFQPRDFKSFVIWLSARFGGISRTV